MPFKISSRGNVGSLNMMLLWIMISDPWQASSKENQISLKVPSKVAALVPRPGSNPFGFQAFDSKAWISREEERYMSTFIQFAVSAAKQALADAEWCETSEYEKEKTGVCFGSGIGSLLDTVSTWEGLNKRGYSRVSPFYVPRILTNMAAGHISMAFGFQGPNHSVSTACTTGAHSLGDAMRFIQFGDADVMVAGGSEASVHALSVGGFSRARSLSTKFNESPQESSRPFDKDRDGFVIGEGAGAVVLEELEHAKKRGARIYAEMKGYGLSGDAHHMTSPPDSGRGAQRAMLRALETANLSPCTIGYINAHATSTEKGFVKILLQ
ncbi:Mitochondrial beta-keto-acyl synthase, variant 3 [Entomophthora muscae]|uniref:Mitochondrial beta-keto-acyl synthase, variant 3 n=1 Tax=Entomophthora muscae TaxID=34485 RepID=A0ACC2S5T3_9FUNG|nr:Mitochondrial beta-keto-acyl synthase, variant 3 [Entomophthora muscae]